MGDVVKLVFKPKPEKTLFPDGFWIHDCDGGNSMAKTVRIKMDARQKCHFCDREPE